MADNNNIRSSNRLISGVDIYNASHTLLVDAAGALVVSANSGALSAQIEDSDGNPLNSTAGSLNVDVTGGSVTVASSLVPAAFDYIALSPTGTNPTTIVYKTGGSGGTTAATLTLTYDGNNNVQTVART